jgi:uncharacterized tellurite resistance protein B-like protein
MTAFDASRLANLDDSQLNALLELMLLAASIDGHLADTELAQLRQCLHDVDANWLAHVDLDDRVNAARKRIESTSRRERLSELKSTLSEPEQRRAALELALRIVTADGVLQMSEHGLLFEVAQALELDSKFTGNLVLGRLF